MGDATVPVAVACGSGVVVGNTTALPGVAVGGSGVLGAVGCALEAGVFLDGTTALVGVFVDGTTALVGVAVGGGAVLVVVGVLPAVGGVICTASKVAVLAVVRFMAETASPASSVLLRLRLTLEPGTTLQVTPSGEV